MSYMMSLEIARDPASTKNARALFDDDVRRAITLSKLGASIADLMLFDRSSLAEARNGGEPPYRILLSDRISAVERFKRRLPSVLEALSWHPIAVETMPRFGKFFENIDWPYVLLETDEYRCNFWDSEWFTTSEEFDLTLEFAVSAIDDRAIAVPGNAFGGEGRYSPAWEKLLKFCFVSPEVIYAGDKTALKTWPWGAPVCSNSSSKLLNVCARIGPMRLSKTCIEAESRWSEGRDCDG